MNTPLLPRVLIGLVASGLLFPCVAQARVGETQEALERRLLQPNLGKVFRRDASRDPREREREEAREEKERREQPFHVMRLYAPKDAPEVIYWKSALAKEYSTENGWKIYVFYMGGRSVLEAYQRVGEKLNDFEIKSILAANRGASSWTKGKATGGGANGEPTSLLGFDYELEDGSTRARVKDNWVLVFTAKLDQYLLEQQKQKAPESVTGF